MKRIASLLLAVCLLCPFAAQATEDYTVAEKLLKQLWAGSGFSGTLTAEVQSQTGTSTAKPIVLDADYIYVRETEESTAEHRLDVTLRDGEDDRTAAHVQLKDGAISLQADVIGEDWYRYAPAQEETPMQAALAQLRNDAVGQTAQTALALLPMLQQDGALASALESYLTRIDVWMEGYREEAVLDKTADGMTTMQVRYTVPSAAIKAQMKQLVLDTLADEKLLLALYEAFDGETARYYFNPVLQNWYFEVIEALPLTGCITLSRTVSFAGDVLETSLSLPLYDAQSGEATFSYEHTMGEGDLPDDHALRFETGEHSYALLYQSYRSMTGVQVVQGSFETADSAVAFTLKQQESLTRDGENRDVYGWDADLTLRPAEEDPGKADFAETQFTLNSRFMSRELKSAPTEADITLSVSNAQTAAQLHFNGTTRKKWEPETLPEARIDLNTLSDEQLSVLLSGALLQLTAQTADHLHVPEQPADVTE